ncbi:MAG: AI-2E family transporter [Lachnospiraceae bacterium]|nr:AI-2E family transporter [Lachnospiraceae bacterium]
MNLNNESIKKIRGLILFTALIVIGLWKYEIILDAIAFLFNIMFPFILGGAIAFILNVPMNFIERVLFSNRAVKDNKIIKKVKKPLSLILSIMLVLGVIFIVIFVVFPQLGNTILMLGDNIKVFLPKVQSWAEDLFKNNTEIIEWIESIQFDWDKMIQSGLDFFKNGAGSVLNTTFAAAKSIVSGLTTFFISAVFACYILLQKKKLTIQIHKVLYAFLPEQKVKAVLAVCSLTYKTFSNFLTGQCMEAVILGTMFFISMSILKMPYALLIGVLIAFTALIPIFGAFIGCVIGAFLILMVNPMQAAGFVVMFLVLQQIEGNLIYPHVVGGSVGLPSIWVLVAVSVGGSLMGLVGMLIFIPIASVIYTLFKEYVHEKLRKKNIVVSLEKSEDEEEHETEE